MKYKYILEEIEKAIDLSNEANANIDSALWTANNKYLYISEECITEINKILVQLEIKIENNLEGEEV